jgi:hypothetical protein
LFGYGTMPVSTGILIDNIIIPIDSKPTQSVENGFNCSLCRSLAVGILNAQEHFSAEAFRIKPIEQGSSTPANMEKSGRGGSKARNDR